MGIYNSPFLLLMTTFFQLSCIESINAYVCLPRWGLPPGPKIVTYDDGSCACNCKKHSFSIQGPVPPPSWTPSKPDMLYQTVPENKPYSYDSMTGLEFPVDVQIPMAPCPKQQIQKFDPFTGAQYGINILGPTKIPRNPDSIGTPLNFGIQCGKLLERSAGNNANSGDPMAYRVDAPVSADMVNALSNAAIPRLTGLTSKVDRILIPKCQLETYVPPPPPPVNPPCECETYC